MNINEKHFNPLTNSLIEKSIVLADYGFRDKDGATYLWCIKYEIDEIQPSGHLDLFAKQKFNEIFLFPRMKC